MSRDIPFAEQARNQYSTPETGSAWGALHLGPKHSPLEREEEGLLVSQAVKETKVGKANKDI